VRYLTLARGRLVRAVEVVRLLRQARPSGNARRIVAPLVKDGQTRRA
jgi:hypothetical protein